MRSIRAAGRTIRLHHALVSCQVQVDPFRALKKASTVNFLHFSAPDCRISLAAAKRGDSSGVVLPGGRSRGAVPIARRGALAVVLLSVGLLAACSGDGGTDPPGAVTNLDLTPASPDTLFSFGDTLYLVAVAKE